MQRKTKYFMIKVSIITVTHNCIDNLRKTLEALEIQDYANIESIIVDGGSTDGTVELIKDFANRFHGEVKWVSERDDGIYDALNKGIKMSTGDVIGCYWDVFTSGDVISKIVKAFNQNPDADGVHSDLNYIDNGKVIRRWKMGEGKIKNGWIPGHPTLYLRRSVYDKYGVYKSDYGVYGDYEFMVRCLSDGSTKLVYIPENMVNMYYRGASNNGINGYIRSIFLATKALRDLRIRHPWMVTFKRILRTAMQFM